jgi:diguanylate cyclase (GGDEF)-like protein
VGGDEFVVLFDDVATKEAAMIVAERLNVALRAPYDIGPDRRIATTSIGVAVGSAELITADDVVAAADAAMYDAKRRGGGRCVLYSEDLHGRRDRRSSREPLGGQSIPG